MIFAEGQGVLGPSPSPSLPALIHTQASSHALAADCGKTVGRGKSVYCPYATPNHQSRGARKGENRVNDTQGEGRIGRYMHEATDRKVRK